MEMTDESQGNKRRADRLYHDVLVAFRGPKKEFVSAQALDFSSVGVFINTSESIPVGTELSLLVSIPGVGSPFEVKGRVARIIGKDAGAAYGGAPGMGVEFLDVTPEVREKVETAVKTLKNALPGINEPSGGGRRA